MRLGTLEIIIIIIVIIVIALITRILRANRDAAAQIKKTSIEVPATQGKERKSKTRSYLKRVGITLTLAGLILALAGISMLKWAIQSYMWSFVIAAIGLALLLLSKRK